MTPELIEVLWKEIKSARDDADQNAGAERHRAERLDALLKRMRDEGMADHLPTLEEVQAAWRGVQ